MSRSLGANTRDIHEEKRKLLTTFVTAIFCVRIRSVCLIAWFIELVIHVNTRRISFTSIQAVTVTELAVRISVKFHMYEEHVVSLKQQENRSTDTAN
ncbi:hypothetical protein AVEN_8530-1 [Araneus ventricosus]|uniref:Uncharacterized protein n=1 Tax=Araneus ventricosus TaxID=182803 RepID=A0A4Y2FMY1_ARAVE|nr:hypothetical protein AVEN_8530-1 [Araneus ventricosus]